MCADMAPAQGCEGQAIGGPAPPWFNELFDCGDVCIVELGSWDTAGSNSNSTAFMRLCAVLLCC